MATKPKSPPQKYVLKIPVEGGELKVQGDKLVEALTRLLDGLGDFVSTLAAIESEYPNLVEGLRKVSSDPSLLQEFTESLRPDVLRLFLLTVLRLMKISPDLNNLNSLPAERKAVLGAEIKSISSLLRKLGDKLKES